MNRLHFFKSGQEGTALLYSSCGCFNGCVYQNCTRKTIPSGDVDSS